MLLLQRNTCILKENCLAPFVDLMTDSGDKQLDAPSSSTNHRNRERLEEHWRLDRRFPPITSFCLMSRFISLVYPPSSHTFWTHFGASCWLWTIGSDDDEEELHQMPSLSEGETQQMKRGNVNLKVGVGSSEAQTKRTTSEQFPVILWFWRTSDLVWFLRIDSILHPHFKDLKALSQRCWQTSQHPPGTLFTPILCDASLLDYKSPKDDEEEANSSLWLWDVITLFNNFVGKSPSKTKSCQGGWGGGLWGPRSALWVNPTHQSNWYHNIV